ncbi:hypothetical protein [Salinicola endophyticus]|uniref:hypothetical protein n=1 Tax=Salinicola endophyticus TaxID=1949083 RepID=UPI0013005092|nr:hypothetical protein [Salinicola endophyticus]
MQLVKSLKEMSRYSRESAFRIRLFDSKGLYPRGVFANEKSLYVADGEVAFSIVYSKPYDQLASDFPYSEMVWATPQEVRFWASILLCEDAKGPRILLYPEHKTFAFLDSQELEFKDSETQLELRRLVVEEAAARKQSLTSIHTFEHDISLGRQAEFLKAIKDTDHVFLRAIACLIKCDMLSRYYEFAEEAIIVAFIALEASFSLVVDMLKRSGTPNPSAKNAGTWLDDTFNRPLGIEPGERRYFEELYEQRVMTMHPSSRYGECPYAPLAVDDLYDLRRDLREVFAYLVSGQHGPEWIKRLRHRGME